MSLLDLGSLGKVDGKEAFVPNHKHECQRGSVKLILTVLPASSTYVIESDPSRFEFDCERNTVGPDDRSSADSCLFIQNKVGPFVVLCVSYIL